MGAVNVCGVDGMLKASIPWMLWDTQVSFPKGNEDL